MTALLEVEDLHVRIGATHAVRGVSFTVERGKTLSIVGESGCGKTMTALGLMGLLPPGAMRDAARLAFDGIDLLRVSAPAFADLRGNRMSMVFQDPMTTLDPVYTVGDQLEEAWLRHRGGGRAAARERALALLARVGIADPAERLRAYPHQLSGGISQRVVIAMALICGPALLLADEPTTALDVTIQAQVLRLLRDLQGEFDLGMLLITHDLGVVARMSTTVAVMYAGELVETGTRHEVFRTPAHPYTRGLLASIPVPGALPPGARLPSIAGAVADRRHRWLRVPRPLPARAGGVRRASAVARAGPRPRLSLRAAATMTAPLLEARGVSVTFQMSRGWLRAARPVFAVRDVSVTLRRGEVLGIVGESGSGKTTLAAAMLNLVTPDAGEVRLDGVPITSIGRRAFARRVQPVFQDPYASLNPYRRIGRVIAQPLHVHGIGTRVQRRDAVREMMERVGLPPRLAGVRPAELSGGQRQRVAIARALVMRPDILVCDEPTSALDVSIQAQILNLLQDLRDELGLSYVLISHNLAVVEYLATTVAVMQVGKIVEQADAATLFHAPRHPYTQALLAAVLTPDPDLDLPA